MFLKNHWYVAAWSEDVGRIPLGRILLNEYVVLFRKADGTPVALENRCPHRNLPLSAGRLIGDEIECGYHGIVFGCDGVCTHVPGTAAAPHWAKVRRYPVTERNRWVFIWLGDPALADLARVPDYHRRLADPDWIAATGQALVKAGYRLVLDNLLDLSHLTYVHRSTTGNRAVAEAAKLSTEVDGDRVTVTRWMADIPPAKAFVDYSGRHDNIDRWQISNFVPPAYIDINNGSTAAGSAPPPADRHGTQGRWGFVVYHAMTPETETTTHQFWCVAAENRCVPPHMRERFDIDMRNVLNEDLIVYEAQQKCIDLDPDALARDVNPRGTIAADEGLLAMRRIIRRLHGEESKRDRPREAAE
jgi:phenylpropionate dioxygenase-like ring-hydroxylating dioxygenase large terminal subunit